MRGRADLRMTDIRLGCTEFPRDRMVQYSGTIPHRTNGVELLEIDANTTLSGAVASQNISVNGGQSSSNRSTRTSVDLPNILAPSILPT